MRGKLNKGQRMRIIGSMIMEFGAMGHEEGTHQNIGDHRGTGVNPERVRGSWPHILKWGVVYNVQDTR